ncbi:hypothetical protein Acry_0536 [Acidiphilium cryptum JF-5]|uniref:Uncharacterized protein n=1 Tax=Acidiphilium cryptum (strain JF-5) TaxID=349163 RepID=A5FVX8_ACICJ|nr:hypothetical protein Acry_0536 [Acidiphilium cryptum JF-5]
MHLRRRRRHERSRHAHPVIAERDNDQRARRQTRRRPHHAGGRLHRRRRKREPRDRRRPDRQRGGERPRPPPQRGGQRQPGEGQAEPHIAHLERLVAERRAQRQQAERRCREPRREQCPVIPPERPPPVVKDEDQQPGQPHPQHRRNRHCEGGRHLAGQGAEQRAGLVPRQRAQRRGEAKRWKLPPPRPRLGEKKPQPRRQERRPAQRRRQPHSPLPPRHPGQPETHRNRGKAGEVIAETRGPQQRAGAKPGAGAAAARRVDRQQRPRHRAERRQREIPRHDAGIGEAVEQRRDRDREGRADAHPQGDPPEQRQRAQRLHDREQPQPEQPDPERVAPERQQPEIQRRMHIAPPQARRNRAEPRMAAIERPRRAGAEGQGGPVRPRMPGNEEDGIELVILAAAAPRDRDEQDRGAAQRGRKAGRAHGFSSGLTPNSNHRLLFLATRSEHVPQPEPARRQHQRRHPQQRAARKPRMRNAGEGVEPLGAAGHRLGHQPARKPGQRHAMS